MTEKASLKQEAFFVGDYSDPIRICYFYEEY